jgi:hypothetical protein
MTTEKLFEQLLGLADEWRVESCTFDARFLAVLSG